MQRKPKGYWDVKEHVFDESRKYQTKKEFQKLSPMAYKSACRNGFIKDIDWLEAERKYNNYWSVKENVFDEARKYRTKSEFKYNGQGAYNVALKNKWLQEMDWFEDGKKITWTKEAVLAEARKYRTKTSFQRGHRYAYRIATQNKWLQEMDWFENGHEKPTKWTKEAVFAEAMKYSSKKEFRKESGGAYRAALKNKWLQEMDWFENVTNPVTDPVYSVYCYKFRDYNTIYIGLTMRPERRAMEHPNDKTSKVYIFAHEHNVDFPEMEVLIDGLYQNEAQLYEDKLKKVSQYTGFNVISVGATGVGTGSLGGATKKWYKKAVFEEARKYNTKNEFKKGCQSAYDKALMKGWLREMDWFEELRKPNGYWTTERIIEEAKKYKTKKEFENNNGTAYQLAWRNKLLDRMDWFVQKHIK